MFKRRSNRNNALVVGGAGTGKTRSYVLPRLLKADCSFVVHDPYGELLAATGTYLKSQGYDVRVLNLKDMEHSNTYNPFRYANEDCIPGIVDSLLKVKIGKERDELWYSPEKSLLHALALYVYRECAPENRSLPCMAEIFHAAVREGEEPENGLEALFSGLDADHPARKCYENFKFNAASRRAVIISCYFRLEAYLCYNVKKLTSTDNIDLYSLRQKKTAVFCTRGWDCLLAELVPTFFSEIFYLLENEKMPGKIPVHLMLDELPGIGIDLNAVTRLAKKKDVSLTLVTHSIDQLKEMSGNEGDWKTLADCCGTQIFSGWSDNPTIAYFCDLVKFRATADELRGMSQDTWFATQPWSSPHFEVKPDLTRHPAYQQTGLYNKALEFDAAKEITTGASRAAGSKDFLFTVQKPSSR